MKIIPKHSAGPWKFGGSNSWVVYAPETGEEICRLSIARKTDEEIIGNSSIITSAPELLKVCEDMVKWFDALKQKQFNLLVVEQSLESAYENWDEATDNTGFDLTHMRAAIEKARGKA